MSGSLTICSKMGSSPSAFASGGVRPQPGTPRTSGARPKPPDIPRPKRRAPNKRIVDPISLLFETTHSQHHSDTRICITLEEQAKHPYRRGSQTEEFALLCFGTDTRGVSRWKETMQCVCLPVTHIGARRTKQAELAPTRAIATTGRSAAPLGARGGYASKDDVAPEFPSSEPPNWFCYPDALQKAPAP